MKELVTTFIGRRKHRVLGVGKFGFVSQTKHAVEATYMDLFHS